jgi:hypothetical protein
MNAIWWQCLYNLPHLTHACGPSLFTLWWYALDHLYCVLCLLTSVFFFCWQTIRMHYANCNSYNADFDGDEMNCHFVQVIGRDVVMCMALGVSLCVRYITLTREVYSLVCWYIRSKFTSLPLRLVIGMRYIHCEVRCGYACLPRTEQVHISLTYMDGFTC